MNATIKASVAAIALTVSCTGVVQAEDVTPEQACAAVHKLADTIMRGRQEGVPMPKMIDAVPDFLVGKELIQSAFNHPRYNTSGIKAQVIQEFANDAYAECYQAVSQ